MSKHGTDSIKGLENGSKDTIKLQASHYIGLFSCPTLDATVLETLKLVGKFDYRKLDWSYKNFEFGRALRNVNIQTKFSSSAESLPGAPQGSARVRRSLSSIDLTRQPSSTDSEPEDISYDNTPPREISQIVNPVVHPSLRRRLFTVDQSPPPLVVRKDRDEEPIANFSLAFRQAGDKLEENESLPNYDTEKPKIMKNEGAGEPIAEIHDSSTEIPSSGSSLNISPLDLDTLSSDFKNDGTVEKGIFTSTENSDLDSLVEQGTRPETNDKKPTIMWAVTKITIFESGSRTYEILGTSPSPPLVVPSSLDGIFVIKADGK